jgi:hypothetical protein
MTDQAQLTTRPSRPRCSQPRASTSCSTSSTAVSTTGSRNSAATSPAVSGSASHWLVPSTPTPRSSSSLEPTTAVDAVTEARIAQGLCRLRRRTSEQATIILTSSPAFLAAADTVVYRPTSGCLLVGRHADLLEADTDSAEAYRDAVTR